MKTVLNYLLVAAFIFASGCACPLPVRLDVISRPPTQSITNAVVYFFRQSKICGCARGVYIHANNERVGGLNSGTYFTYNAPSGTNVFWAEDWLRKEKLHRVYLHSGESYYFEGDLHFGFLDAVPYVQQVDSIVGEKMVEELKHAVLKK